MPLLGTIGEASARAYGLYGNRSRIELTIDSNTYNYYVYTNRGPTYSAGSSDIVVTVNPGVTVGSTATPTYAMLVPSSFNPGDTVTIVNNGVIQGMGGAGGPGGATVTGPFPGASRAGNPGAAGGNAIYVNRPTVITNNGTVAGGGGGGGGGGSCISQTSPKNQVAMGGGGGGGGAGFNGGGAGSGGPAGSPAANPYPGFAGSAGTSPAGGGGGPRRTVPPASGFAGAGGAGGGRGAAGVAGEASPAAVSVGRPGGSAGGAGNYIVGNPFVTWPVTGTRQGGVA